MRTLKRFGAGLLALIVIFTVQHFMARLDYVPSELFEKGDTQTFAFQNSDAVKELEFNYSSSDIK